MAFWRPGTPVPAHADPWDLDCDAEKHRALPVFNPSDRLPVDQQRKRLPIYKHRLQILHAVETHRAVVLCGATGCGKSTQLPQYLDDAGWTAKGYVVCITLPRRLAAVTVAQRVSQEMGVELGREVGYRIRFESYVTPGVTRLEFVTEGILLREMLSDPLLTRFSVIVLDEAHERSANTDLLLGLLKKILRKRPRLRVVVASATLDAGAFLNFLQYKGRQGAAPPPKRPRLRGWDDESGETLQRRAEELDWRRLCVDLSSGGRGGVPERDCCLLEVEGRLHDVQVHYLDEPSGDYVESAVNVVMNIHRSLPEGDILVFLTGREEIEATCSLIIERLQQAKEMAERPSLKPKPLQVVPLHGTLPKEQQLKAFVMPAKGNRKVVVATNIAEASVTIDGIVYVVDSCLVKLDAFCPYNGTSYLNIAACSRSSARQRAGRAGRTRKGHCFRLLTEAAFHKELQEHTLPEVQRSDLKDLVLTLKCLGVDDLGAFEFPTAPARETLELALEELYALGAIDAEARLVEPLGLRMAHGPLPASLMRLLLLSVEAPYQCAAEAAIACAMLTMQPPWLPSQNKERLQNCKESFAVYEGDLVSLLNIYRQYEVYREQDTDWAKRHLLNAKLLDRAMKVKQQLGMYLSKFSLPEESCGSEVARLQRLACASLFLNAARRLPNGSYRLCRAIDEARAPHARFQLHYDSVLAKVAGHAAADFVVFAEAQGTGDQAMLLHNTRIQPEWLVELAPHYFKQIRAGEASMDL